MLNDFCKTDCIVHDASLKLILNEINKIFKQSHNGKEFVEPFMEHAFVGKPYSFKLYAFRIAYTSSDRWRMKDFKCLGFVLVGVNSFNVAILMEYGKCIVSQIILMRINHLNLGFLATFIACEEASKINKDWESFVEPFYCSHLPYPQNVKEI